MPRGEEERLEPVLAREGRTPIMHLVSTRRWGQLRGGAGGAQRTRTHPEAYQAGPGCWGATGSHGGVGACSGKSPPGADPRARSGRRSPGRGGASRCGAGRPWSAAGVGQRRPPRATPEFCPPPVGFLRVGPQPQCHAPSPRNLSEVCFVFLDLLPSLHVFVPP